MFQVLGVAGHRKFHTVPPFCCESMLCNLPIDSLRNRSRPVCPIWNFPSSSICFETFFLEQTLVLVSSFPFAHTFHSQIQYCSVVKCYILSPPPLHSCTCKFKLQPIQYLCGRQLIPLTNTSACSNMCKLWSSSGVNVHRGASINTKYVTSWKCITLMYCDIVDKLDRQRKKRLLIKSDLERGPM